MQPRIVNMEHIVHSLEFGDNQLVDECYVFAVENWNFMLSSQSLPIFLAHSILFEILIIAQTQVCA